MGLLHQFARSEQKEKRRVAGPPCQSETYIITARYSLRHLLGQKAPDDLHSESTPSRTKMHTTKAIRGARLSDEISAVVHCCTPGPCQTLKPFVQYDAHVTMDIAQPHQRWFNCVTSWFTTGEIDT